MELWLLSQQLLCSRYHRIALTTQLVNGWNKLSFVLDYWTLEDESQGQGFVMNTKPATWHYHHIPASRLLLQVWKSGLSIDPTNLKPLIHNLVSQLHSWHSASGSLSWQLRIFVVSEHKSRYKWHKMCHMSCHCVINIRLTYHRRYGGWTVIKECHKIQSDVKVRWPTSVPVPVQNRRSAPEARGLYHVTQPQWQEKPSYMRCQDPSYSQLANCISWHETMAINSFHFLSVLRWSILAYFLMWG